MRKPISATRALPTIPALIALGLVYALLYGPASAEPYPAAAVAKEIGLCVPASGEITQGYTNTHKALDIVWRAGDDDNVYAAADGTIVELYRFDNGRSGQPWHGVMIDHAGNFRTIYLHLGKKNDPKTSYINPTILARLPVELRDDKGTAGQAKVSIPVKRGDVLGRQGDAGISDAVHVHFQLQAQPQASDLPWANAHPAAVNPLDGYFDTSGITSTTKRAVQSCSGKVIAPLAGEPTTTLFYAVVVAGETAHLPIAMRNAGSMAWDPMRAVLRRTDDKASGEVYRLASTVPPGATASWDISTTGSACHTDRTEPSSVLLAMGLPRERALGALRLSLGKFTSDDDVETAASALIASWRRLTA